MGCLCDMVLDPKLKAILDKLKKQAVDIADKCVKERLTIEAEKALKISERHSDIATLFNQKKAITEDLIKDYNRQELSIDKKLVLNEVDKIQKLLDFSVGISNQFKNEFIEKFNKQLSFVPQIAQAALKKKIYQITSYTNAQFLQSTFGKSILRILEKYGASTESLEKYVKNLADAAAKRREEERKEFNIAKNEFDDDYSEKMLFPLIEKICKELSPPSESE